MFFNNPQESMWGPNSEYVMKFTYHDVAKKLSAYIKVKGVLRCTSFASLKEQVKVCLFQEHEQPQCDLRFYWIDQDGDEIEIVHQHDFDIFADKNSQRQHLHVAAVRQEEPAATNKQSTAATDAAAVPPAKGATAADTSVHEHVECDGCGAAPIVGFRYKCIQCPNFDLCQRCEGQHLHVQHMMVRMPNPNCPNVVEAWISGRYGRRGGKRPTRGSACPFMPTPAAAAEATTSAANREAHRHHKHHHRQMKHGIFSHLYDMMQDLAEGGAAVATDEKEQAVAATVDARAAAQAAGKAAQTASVAAQTAAAKAVEATAKMAEAAASQAAHDIATAYATAAAAFEPPKADQSAAATSQAAATDTDNATPSAPNEPYVQQSRADNDSTPVLSSPTLENLAQYIDPQYMKAGIQILNNFSEMFAKMLDPADGAAAGCPFKSDTYVARKESSDSAASSTTSMSNSEYQQPSNTEQADQKKQPAAGFISSAAASRPVENAQTPERRRSNSEEDDWTVVQPPSGANESFAEVSTATNPEFVEGAATAVMNFAELSENLKAHVAEEQKREEQAKMEQSIAAISIVTEAATTTASAAPVYPATPTMTAPTAARPKVAEEKRAVPVFHADQRINNAVLAMMAMGFSNEGAWLTQLLESVNGNIPEALDLMTAAQRQNQ